MSFTKRINSHRSAKVPDLAIALAIGVTLFATCLLSEEPELINGRVAEVRDGDTISFCPKIDEECKSSEQFEVDLWGIDAPEMQPLKQFHAEKAKDYLESVVKSKVVILEVKETEDSGKKIAKLFVVGADPSNLNVHLLMEGHAWSTAKGDLDALEYDLAQDYAKERKLGLWREVEPVAPWDWRKQHEEESSEAETPEESEPASVN
ncbi:MAG: thermonuclease family protein [Gammaproteobacteria bacterium]|nr:thermonuclease family protein [Gammaproteobacteria bacterium]